MKGRSCDNASVRISNPSSPCGWLNTVPARGGGDLLCYVLHASTVRPLTGWSGGVRRAHCGAFGFCLLSCATQKRGSWDELTRRCECKDARVNAQHRARQSRCIQRVLAGRHGFVACIRPAYCLLLTVDLVATIVPRKSVLAPRSRPTILPVPRKPVLQSRPRPV